jgi:hypothetical protein
VALAEADLEEVDAGTDDEDEDVGVPELEALLGWEVVEETTESDAVAPVADASSAVEVEESFEKSSESSSEGLSDVGEALLDAAEVIVADVVATLPVAAVSGTALPAEQVMSGTPSLIP